MVWIMPWGILVVYDPHCLELPAVSVLHRIEFFRFLKEQRLCKMHIVWYDIHTFIFWFSVLNNKSCLQTRLLYSRETTLDEKWNALKNKFLGIKTIIYSQFGLQTAKVHFSYRKLEIQSTPCNLALFPLKSTILIS